LPCEGQTKNQDMQLCVACAWNPLVKGERKVHIALATLPLALQKNFKSYIARVVFPGKPYGTISTFTHGTQNFITSIGFTLHIGHLQIGFWGRQRDFLGMLFTAWCVLVGR